MGRSKDSSSKEDLAATNGVRGDRVRPDDSLDALLALLRAGWDSEEVLEAVDQERLDVLDPAMSRGRC